MNNDLENIEVEQNRNTDTPINNVPLYNETNNIEPNNSEIQNNYELPNVSNEIPNINNNQPPITPPNEKNTFSDNEDLNKKLKIILGAIIGIVLVYLIIISPLAGFISNKSKLKSAGERYFAMYTHELPTGERVGSVSLEKLHSKGFLEEDLYVPYSLLRKKICSVEDSWVKVKKVNGKYKYYTYLKCGILSSFVDHKGPKITLNGEKEMTISLGEKFQDPGVNKVKDSKDGELAVKDVVAKGEVNTNKIGTYEIEYIAFDKLKNKSTVKRTVKVVQKLNSTVKKETKKLGYYQGLNPNNYIMFSGMMFRIVDVDGDNVRIIADKDVANVNYDGIEEWLKYYYEHISKESKKLVVKNKYCSMTLQDESKTTECNNYTKKREVYIPSIVDANKAETEDGNYLRPRTMTWIAEIKSNTEAYLTRNVFYNELYGRSYVAFDKKYNFGVRPILTIKGDTLIKKGNGTETNPYLLGDFEFGQADEKINERFSGEYIKISNSLWRIVEKQDDGTTKVISDTVLYHGTDYLMASYGVDLKSNIYGTKEKENIGYQINNKSSEYIDTKYFVNHEVEIPVYKTDAKYKKEIKTEKIKAKIVAPNMYEMFSATSFANTMRSYWLINSSQKAELKYGVSDTGIVMYGESSPYVSYGVRPAGYLHKDSIIVSGKGTKENPYIIDK